jgi:hypothetical protein
MTDFVFADRYAEAGISPAAQIIMSRQTTAERIVENIDRPKIVALAGTYYGSPGIDLVWLRDEFVLEDPTFSLVNNERETRVLAAAILGALIEQDHATAVLAVVAGNVGGRRPPPTAEWLLNQAGDALLSIAVEERTPAKIDTKVGPTTNSKMPDEIAALGLNDVAALQTVLSNIRTETLNSGRTIARQASNALAAMDLQVRLQREEGQMLWWLVGGHSRSLERSFSSFTPQQAGLVGALDLATLTTVSKLGPVAAPALLERVISLARKAKGAPTRDLAGAVDGLTREDLKCLPLITGKVPAPLAPVMTALELAISIGAGNWHARFQELTGFDASFTLEPEQMATQLYREHLLAQLL